MKNLISMMDFVLEQEKEFNRANVGFAEFTNNVCNYAKLLKQPLELWMFVPCNNNGNILDEPNYLFRSDSNDLELMQKWEQAKKRCLFLSQSGEDFDSALASVYLDEFFNVEQLSNNIRLIRLTETSIKQIGM